MHANAGMHEHANASKAAIYTAAAAAAAAAKIGKPMTMNQHACILQQHLLLLLQN
jgi:hypothetical protein